MKKIKKIHMSTVAIYIVLFLLAFICIFPFLHVLAISLSDKALAAAGEVTVFPKRFTVSAYKYILNQMALWKSFVITLIRVLLGTGLSTLCTIITAYPISMSNRRFGKRTVYVWYFFITTLINGGLIPGYILVQNLGLMNSIWALVLPCTVNVFNIIVLSNFYRQLPPALSEAAELDGAGHLKILFYIYVPLSLPAIATIVLFTVCYHWNSWFDGSIYMQADQYPLATYLQSVIVASNNISSGVSYEEIMAISNKTVSAAQIIISTIPILLVYPFLQKYFVSGLTVGGVKE
ncbi:MAG: carbohydrate ABC transporter permease [Tyzzerella sp.]|nr:carbohydrate ABC transporter permease [Tyzzerella sp.]